MNEKTKESKFLDAINKYAESQKAQITQEIEEYKNTKIEQATEQGLKDAYELIKSDIASRKAAIVNDTARRELEIRNGLFEKRRQICSGVFEEAEKRLREFAQSRDYPEWLKKQAVRTAELFGDKNCTVYLSHADSDKISLITKILPKAEIKTDNRITIGGMRSFCRELGITADCTLDMSLKAQRKWFTENSGLKVV